MWLTDLPILGRPLALRGLRQEAWKAREVPPACRAVPTMLMDDELRLLDYLADRYWSGKGIIVDAGCFLGGSTLALASGLRANLERRGRPESPLIHSYDLFRIEGWTIGPYFPETRKAGESLRSTFESNIEAYSPLVRVHEGDIAASEPPDRPIELLFIDLAKNWMVCDWITEHLFPRLIPGRSVVIQQDYLWGASTGWLQVTMEYYSEEFEILCDTDYNSVAFLLRKPFAPGRIRPRLVENLPVAEKAALMDRAAARFPPEQAAILKAAKDDFLAILERLG
ncbi:MAG TPA: class I SAM-dependent methyltransferase [Allosphingosinicella sp.]|jgi:hypothetical protein